MHAKSISRSVRCRSELELWISGTSVRRFTDTAPLGYWVRDQFCLADSTLPSCADYRTPTTQLIPRDLRLRSYAELRFNYVCIQNYISDGDEGMVWHDDLVIAKRRITCLQW